MSVKRNIVEVETKTFIRFWLVILGFAAFFYFLFSAKEALIIIGAAALLAIAIKPLANKVDLLIGKKKQTTLSSILAYLGILLVLGIVVSIIGPVLVNETVKFVGQLPETFEKTIGGIDGLNEFGKNFGIADLRGQITSNLESFSSAFISNLGSTLVTSVSAILSILAKAVIVLVLTLLFLLEGPEILEKFWKTLSGKKKDATVEEMRRIVKKMANVVSTFFSKQVLIALLDGAVTTLIVLILSLIFGFNSGLAAPMGVITATMYLIPMFGQIIGCLLVSLLLAFSSPAGAATWLIFYLIYGQIEANMIAPKVQGNALRLPPVVILIAITIGTYMFGLVGAIIAIPIAGCIKVLVEEYPILKELREES
ncbi:AI-2E family transporter [Candidatus Saccharibacteria bacterium]|nr:AI-2E family transporter [Candidatus Saccharibacteria bacterium]